jgi:hypothetical protein
MRINPDARARSPDGLELVTTDDELLLLPKFMFTQASALTPITFGISGFIIFPSAYMGCKVHGKCNQDSALTPITFGTSGFIIIVPSACI